MSNSERHDGAATAKGPRRFFQKQLAGEQPLSFETAGQLYELARTVLSVKPWEVLEDQDLILVKDTESGEICYCSVMGAMEEVFSVQVYVGAERYRFFRKIASGKPITAGDFYASMRGVSVEYVTPSKLDPPDRELLEAFGHPKKRGKRAPVFRSSRPGYLPWYVTESEARLLVSCLHATLTFFCHAEESHDIDFWSIEDEFPLLVPITDDKTCKLFDVSFVQAPEPPVAAPQAAEVDENLIAGLLQEKLPRRGALETDHFFTNMPIGEPAARKACLRMAMVSDGDSGFAFMPELGKPEDPTAQLLARALVGAMHQARCVPTEVRVVQKEFKILLANLSERLGFNIRVTKSLPALDALKTHFLQTIGEPEAFLG